MASLRPRDLLSDDLLSQLEGRPGGAGTVPADALRRDIGRLTDAGYLKIALPAELGGLGCTLRQAACGQRRLARHAPQTALAVSSHLYWTGAAADACRAGDDSVRWILAEAARGALFAGGHGPEAGGDLRLADPRSRCEPGGPGGYRFTDPAALSTMTPSWDWIAVHAVSPGRSSRGDERGVHGERGGPESVVAFAGRDPRCGPAFRVARAQPAGAPGDVFCASALVWGHSVLASAEYSVARRAFNGVVAMLADSDFSIIDDGDDGRLVAHRGQHAGPGHSSDGNPSDGHPRDGHPLDGWPVAEAGLRLDAMKARIAAVTHPWPLVPDPVPDLGGQRLISLHAMRHEVTEGARRVHDLVARLTAAAASLAAS